MTEMERVVAAMRKVVERLQSENESLRKSAAKPRGTGVAQLEAENKKLKVFKELRLVNVDYTV